MHTSMESLFIQLDVVDDEFCKIDTYYLFCGPGSHM